MRTPTALEPEEKPFAVEHLRLHETPVGFTPAARLIVMPALRTAGLLPSLSDEAARSLLALLTFLTPNGHLHPTVPEIAAALGVSERQARDRLRRLTAVTWRGEPIAVEVRRATGMNAFSLSPTVLSHTEPPEADDEAVALPIPLPSSREAVVAHSRHTYARPRTEVEAEILAFLGHHPDEAADTPQGAARRGLLALGVPAAEVNELVEAWPVERILEQIAWLPHREARNPARFVVAAIRNGYAPPREVSQEREPAHPDGPSLSGTDAAPAGTQTVPASADITGDSLAPAANRAGVSTAEIADPPPTAPVSEEAG
jgi:hypothetical protein